MKTRILCSVLALFCLISMYVPVVAPRYPAGDYYAPSGSYEAKYYYTGEYYLAKDYWSITDHVFATSGFLGRAVISLTQALLILWAWMSVQGDAGKKGLAISILNLVVVGAALIRMMSSMWSCRWGVVVLLALDAAAAIAMAATSIEEK